ncbi:SagB/ThcOx family dehydrogenase, partial [bacterium]|nr:SagB/ThcOx family dehydrogenase [bacterium]
IGDEFQKRTKYRRSRGERPEIAAEPMEGTVPLPEPRVEGGEPLWSVVEGRRSVRAFADAPLTLEQLSQLLWATQGISARDRGFAFRTSPSAGACYPLNTYLVVHRVEGLEPGLYGYDVESAALRKMARGDLSEAIRGACLDQSMAAMAAVVFVWTAVPARSKQRYHERAYRYISSTRATWGRTCTWPRRPWGSAAAPSAHCSTTR